MTRAVITGTEFRGAGFTASGVKFGSTGVSTPCTGAPSSPCFTIDSGTQITAYSPSHVAGTFDVTVTTPGGGSAKSSSDRYTYVAPAPTFTTIAPTSGSVNGGDQVVAISGSGFAAGTTDLFWGWVDVPSSNAYPCAGASMGRFQVNSDAEIDAYPPGNPAGLVTLTIQTACGTAGGNYT